jgi:hypothetical protein
MRNCYIGGQICAYARQVIYEHMQTVDNVGGEIIYVDCDALIFSLPKNVPNPLKISHALGDFKNVVDGKILEFYSFGIKNYSILYEKGGQLKHITKIKGLSFYTIHNDLTHEIYKQLIEDAFNQQKTSLYLCQHRKNPKKSSMPRSLQNYTFTNRLSTRRIIVNTVTFPYGYKDL